MNDINKFQDGGFIPKEVFIEARAKRRVIRIMELQHEILRHPPANGLITGLLTNAREDFKSITDTMIGATDMLKGESADD